MKALNSIATFTALAVFSAATAFADVPRRGAAVFVDGFDAVGTFAENWGKPHGKVKSEDGRMVANAIGTVTQASPARTAPLDILVDKGLTLGWMTNGSTDLLGNPRLVDTRGVAFSPAALPDLGCFEIQERKPSGFAGIIF